MIIAKPHLLNKLTIKEPRWHDRLVLLHKRKVDFGTGTILIDFTSNSLKGQHFAIKKQDAQRCEVGTNGKAEMYLVPLDKFKNWDSAADVREIALNIWKD